MTDPSMEGTPVNPTDHRKLRSQARDPWAGITNMAVATAPTAGDAAEEGGSRSPQGSGRGNGQPARQPFTAAAHELIKPAGISTSDLITANQQDIGGPFLLPPSGYLRHSVLEVDATGGSDAGTAADGDEDAPFNALANIAFRDIGGDALLAPMSGYDLYLVNKYGGYEFMGDPRSLPDFSDVAGGTGDFAFTLRIPHEIVMRSAFGSLANQDARSSYAIEAQLAASGTIFDTAPDTTLPTLALRGALESWSQPLSSDPVTGAPNEVEPPALGSFQRWTREVHSIDSGDNQVTIDTVGNFIRCIIFKLEAPTGTRSTSNWPTTTTLRLDDKDLYRNIRQDHWRGRMAAGYGYDAADDAALGLDTGVFVWAGHNDLDGHPGFEERRRYLRTTKATDLVLEGNFGAAGQLVVLVNEVVPRVRAN